jgi:hypothetical protein
MSFFDEEFINEEIEQIEFLRDLVNGLEDTIRVTQNEELVVEYWHAMYALVDKQHVVYTRLMYTDDPEALILKKNLEDVARETNNSLSPINMPQYYSIMKTDIKGFIQGLTGEDLSDYEGIDIDIDL